MTDIYFASEEALCKLCYSYKDDLMDKASQVLFKSSGNRHIDDVVQDTVIRALSIFLNANIVKSEFKPQLISLCENVAFEYYWGNKKDLSKPRPFIKSTNEDERELDEFLWSKRCYENDNAEHKIIIREDISNIKEYRKRWLSFPHARDYVATLHLKSKRDWDAYIKSGRILKNIPPNPP